MYKQVICLCVIREQLEWYWSFVTNDFFHSFHPLDYNKSYSKSAYAREGKSVL